MSNTNPIVCPFEDDGHQMRVVIDGLSVAIEEARGVDALGVTRWHLVRFSEGDMCTSEWVGTAVLAVVECLSPKHGAD